MFLILMTLRAYGSLSDERILLRLDSSLSNKSTYEEKKLQDLQQLYRQARNAQTEEALYKAYIRLYDEYKSYKYDSATVYASKCMHIAASMKHVDYMMEAHCIKAFCLLSAGLYKEAFDEMEAIDLRDVSTEYRKRYYAMQTRLNYDIADYNHAQPYLDEYLHKGHLYTDSLLHHLPPESADWWYAVGMRQLKKRQYTDCIHSFTTLLKQSGLDIHTKAIITSCMGWVYEQMGNESQAMNYLAQAAIYDNESVTKETTALRMLGGYLYRRGDIARAMEYVRMSLDDANFYDARQRKIEIGNILPIIEQDRFAIVKRERNAMVVATVVVVILLLVLLVSTILIRRQMKKLQLARRIIEERNASLQQSNDKLQEANKIKDEYIGKSFYLNAEYINKVEKLYKTIDRKIASRQFDDLRTSLKESTLNSERKNMFADFDETFLRLFPHFVEKYNELFSPDARKLPDDEKSLTTEMRIFALIRLGIGDSERIANFLDYSVHTINTYKTRVKNKSVVDNDLFEQKIMEI